MKGNLQQQPQVKILPVLNVNERLRSREADIDEVVRTVKGVLPQHVDGNIDVTITPLGTKRPSTGMAKAVSGRRRMGEGSTCPWAVRSRHKQTSNNNSV